MTDLDKTLKAVMRETARRLNVPAIDHCLLTVDMEKHIGQPIRKKVEIRFMELEFTTQLPRTSHTNTLKTLELDVVYGKDSAIFNLMGSQIALLHYSEWQDWQDDLPPLDTYMDYQAFVAAWSDNSYQLVMRTVLAAALGVEIPAIEHAVA